MMKKVLIKSCYVQEKVVQELAWLGIKNVRVAVSRCWANLIGIDPTPIFRLSKNSHTAILNILLPDRASFLRRIIIHIVF